MRSNVSPWRIRPKWHRPFSVAVVTLFVWTALLAVPAQVLAHGSLQKPRGVRSLSLAKMQHIRGSQVPGHMTACDGQSGSTYPWEASVGGVNSGNGNKLTQVPLVSWTARGGMAMAFTLAHNSQSVHDSELGYKWTHSFDLFLVAASGDSGNTVTVHWGDDLSYVFTENIDGSYSAPTGIHDILVKNTDSTYTLTKTDQTKFHYTTGGYCDTITDRNANQISISYTTGNFVSVITDPTGRTISLAYDGSNRISTVTDEISRVWTLSYDSSNNLSTITYPELGTTYYSETFGYNSAHDITSFQDKRGHTWSYSYNSSDNSLASETTPYSQTTSYSYTSTATTVTDPNSHSVVYTYSSGKLSQTTDQASHSESYVYDSAFNRTQVTGRNGYTSHFTFDSARNMLTAEDPYSNYVATVTYNSDNFPLTVTDALGNETVTTYDSHDNATEVQQKNSGGTVLVTNSFAYNTYGLMTSKTDGNSHTVNLGYSSNGDLNTVEDANSNTTAITVTDLGWITEITESLSHITSFSQDAWGRNTSVTNPTGATTTTVLDANSNPTSVTDGDSHTSTATFDYENRPLVVTRANGDAVTYAYDGSGQVGLLSTKSDGNSHVTYYSYTNRNQPYITTYADSTTEGWSYNNDGTLASHVDGNSHTLSYGYDHRGLLTSVSYPTGTGISYTLDVTGQRTAMTDATGSTSFTIDGAGRTTGVTTPNGTVGYAFDTASLRTSMSLTGTGTWYYSFDAGNRLTQIVNPASETSSFSYDAANRQTGQVNGDGSTVTTTFDNTNRPTDILHQTSTGTTLAEYQYSYDGASNVTSWTDSDGTVTSLGYDASDQLTSEVRDNSHSTGYSLGYTYDHNSNRLTKVVGTGGGAVTTTNTYGTHDQLLTSGSKSYGYDYNGNCTSVTVGTSVTSISYDYENRVVGIVYPSSATNSFAYNGDDMRMQKVDSAGTANYVCDGTAPASPVLSDSSAIYTPGLSERRSSTSKFYHGDNLGSTRGITNSSQSVTDAILYDAFGNTISRTGTTPTPFGFVGQGQYQTDNDSGLMLLGHRYYDASVGRFISSDPAKAGNNWYAYCENNPLTRIDPNGECFIIVAIIVLVAIDLLVHSEQAAGEHPPGYQLPRQSRVPWLTPALGGGAPGISSAMAVLAVAVDGPAPGSAMGGPATGTVNTPGPPIPGSPRFIAPSNGPAIEIPPGYTGRVADNGKGSVWQPPGATGNNNAIRIADPNPQYPGGYSRTYNPGGQPIDPSTGRPGPDSATHTPIEWAPMEEE